MNPYKPGKPILKLPSEKISLSLLDPSKTSKETEVLRKFLEGKLIGQKEAINAIVNVYQTYISGFNPTSKPIGNFLFLGPTGTGKTRIVELTAENLGKNPKSVVKIDCAEFQHSHEIAKLIGSPPGYLGHRETHPMLSQEVLNQYHTENCKLSFVLFDEIEKASDALWNLLLGILDKATLTLGDNRKVDFSKAMLFMTSNLGSDKIAGALTSRIGFHAGVSVNAEDIADKLIKISDGEVKRKFTPEFVNRLDQIVTFQPLNKESLIKILELELAMVQQRIIENGKLVFALYYTDACKDFLLKEGTDIKYGARHLKRAIEMHVVKPVANLVGSDQVKPNDTIKVDHSKANGITFERVKEIVK